MYYTLNCRIIRTPFILLLTIFLLFISLPGKTQQNIQSYNLRQKSAFIENKGQIADQNGKLRNDIKYIYSAPGLKLILKANSFSYEVITYEKGKKQGLTSKENTEKNNLPFLVKNKFKNFDDFKVNIHRIDVSFIGSNPFPLLIAEEQNIDFNNYYLGYTPEEGINQVFSYNKLIYKDLYPNIDIVFYAKKEGILKYDIVVHPGGKLEDVKMKYEGMTNLSLVEGKLRIESSFGEINEIIPYSFQKEDQQKVNISYNLQNEYVSFKNKYNNKKTLIIDPYITWSTYYGGNDIDFPYAITNDYNGNVFITGRTNSTSGIATTGAFQSSFGGGGFYGDAFIVKMDDNGKRIWGTYYGGTYHGGGTSDASFNICSDKSGNIYIIGNTISDSGLSTPGCYKYKGDTYDAFLAKFNNNGKRIWGTYYGGNKGEEGIGIRVDNNYNVFITGYTTSTTGIATTGAHQASFGGGYSDAFIAKFDSNGLGKWGTYYGGSTDEFCEGISVDSKGGIYITGTTGSTTGIASSGAQQTSIGGNTDAFLAKFNTNGVRQWGTYFGGTGDEIGFDINTTDSGNTYITGFTSGSIPVKNAFQTKYGGGYGDAFIAKFNSSGISQWCTFYGGNDYDAGYGISSDVKENVYISGTTNSKTGLSTVGAHQTKGGGEYSFVGKFNSKGDRLWGTYFYGKDTAKTTSTAVAADDSGNVYVTGYTNSRSDIATTGAYQTTYAGGAYDAFIAKFPDMYCDVAAFIKGDTSICSNSIQSYTTQKGTGINYLWSVSGGTITTGQNKDSISVRWGSAGKGTVKVIVWSTLRCKDSIIINTTINPLPNALVGSGTKICSGISVPIGATAVTGSKYEWKSNPVGFTSTSSNPIVAPNVTTIYYLTETLISSGCSKTDSVIIEVDTSIGNNIISSSQVICSGQAPALFVGSKPSGGGGNYSYLWESSIISSNSGFKFGSNANTNQNYAQGNLTQTTYFRRKVTTSTCTGLQTSISNVIKITVNPPITNNSITSSQKICSGQKALKIKGSLPSGGNGTYQYVWQDSIKGSGWRTIDSSIDYYPGILKNNSIINDSVIYFRRIINSGECNGSQASISNIISITVYSLPENKIKGDTSFCANDLAFYSNNFDSGSYTNWTVQGGRIVQGQGTNLIKVIWDIPGRGMIKAVKKNKLGCINSDSIYIAINKRPTANFKAANVCQGDTTALFDSSIQAIKYFWNFGDGDTSTLINPVHIYQNAGTYQVKLVIVSASGCLDSITKPVIVNPVPKSDFRISNKCFGDSTKFTNTSTSAATYLWYFGDGNTSTLENPSHNYSAAGSFLVKLKVWNGTGCFDSLNKTITINPLPFASFTVAQDTSVDRTFSLSSTTNAKQYLWSFGDGKIDSGKTVKHTYLTDSIYKISLAVRDTNGCTDITDTTINVFTVGINKLSAPAFELKLYPNPFTNTTTLAYNLQEKAKTEISVYDLAGKEIAVLQNGTQPEGKHIIPIDAERYQLKAGVYILKILIGNQIISRQLIKLKE